MIGCSSGGGTEHRLPCCQVSCPNLLFEWLRWSWGPRSHMSFSRELSSLHLVPAQSSGLQRCVRHDSCLSGEPILVVGYGMALERPIVNSYKAFVRCWSTGACQVGWDRRVVINSRYIKGEIMGRALDRTQCSLPSNCGDITSPRS